MRLLHSGHVVGRTRSKLAAIGIAAAMGASGLVLAAGSSPAGAQTTDPLGPTIAQIEAAYAGALANAETTYLNTVATVEHELADYGLSLGPGLVDQLVALVLNVVGLGALTDPSCFDAVVSTVLSGQLPVGPICSY
ncbi:MAG TPA: hypothetical protein VGF87_08980 [Acidimicrobiales bacterium]|jgi:hypothetical protein